MSPSLQLKKMKLSKVTRITWTYTESHALLTRAWIINRLGV